MLPAAPWTISIATSRLRSSELAVSLGYLGSRSDHLGIGGTTQGRVNINQLGEAVLGEEEARAQLDQYLCDLKNPDIEYVSVKISTIFSQIIPLAFDHSVKMVSKRLAELYRMASSHHFNRPDGTALLLSQEEERNISPTGNDTQITLPKIIYL